MVELPQRFQVSVTGMALFYRGLENDGELYCYLINDAGHRQMVSFRALDVIGRGNLGEQTNISLDTSGEEIVSIEVYHSIKFTLIRSASSAESWEEDPKGLVDLSGLATAEDLNLAGLDGDKLSECQKFHIPDSWTVTAGNHVLKPESGKPIAWKFVPSGMLVDETPGAGKFLSNKVFCGRRIPYGSRIMVEVDNSKFILSSPGGGGVSIAVSNVPPSIDFQPEMGAQPGEGHHHHHGHGNAIELEGPAATGLTHVMVYTSVYGTAPSDIHIPVDSGGGADKPNGICPPVNGGP